MINLLFYLFLFRQNLYIQLISIVEYENDNQIGKINLDTSEEYILREAVEDMRKNQEQGAEQYLMDMQSQRGSLPQSQLLNQTSRRIVTSIFYKRDLWEQDPSQYIFYDKMIKLAAKGIPNPLRQTLWLEIGKANKYSYIIDELLRKYYCDLAVDNLQNKKSYVYRNLLKKSFTYCLELKKQNIISEMQEDIMWYRQNSLFMDDQIHSNVTNIFYSYCHYVELQGGKVIYSKYLIPIAVKALDYFRSVSEEIDNTIEENVFWLVVCFSNNYAKRYYNTMQMMQNVEHTQTITSQVSLKINKSMVQSKFLAQSAISSLHGNNRPQINTNKQANKLNFIPDDIRLDILIFEFYLKEKNDKLATFLQNLSFGVGLYFAERMLCFFADLFNHELLFRLWDYLFIEGSSKNSLKATYFGISVMIYHLNKYANNIMNICKSRQEILLQIQLSAKFEVDCDLFLSETITIYNDLMQKEPNKFQFTQNNQTSQTQSSANILTQTTKKIFNSIMNVSRGFLDKTLQRHLEVIDQAYNQLDMQKYLNQMMFIQKFIMGKDNKDYKIDLSLLNKTLDELERDLERRSQVQYQSRNSHTSSMNQKIKARERSFQDLSRATTPFIENNLNGRVRSTSQISINSSINRQQQFQQKEKIQHLKPIYNFYSKSPIIQKIFIHIHQIQMVEDYNELSIRITISGFTKNYTVKKVSFTQIIDYFDISNQNKFQGMRSNFGTNSQQNQSNIYQQQSLQDSNKMIIEVYENINNISHPIKQTTIDLKIYEPDTITKDYIYLFEFNDEDDTMSPNKIHNTNSNYFNQFANNNNNQIQNRNQTQQSPYDNDLENNINKYNPKQKTNYSSGIEFSILIATSQGLGELEQPQNMVDSQILQPNRSYSNLGNTVNQQRTSQAFSNNNLQDKFNFVPDVLHIHKNQQIESKLKAFNLLKSQNQLDAISNKSLHTIKSMWKQSSALTQDEFKIFADSTGLKVWQEIDLTEVYNHFQFEGRICLFDLIVACILQIEGCFPQKIELLNRIFSLSKPQYSFNQSEDAQCDNKQKLNYNKFDNPLVYLSMISEIYCKNMLYLPFDQHLNSLKLNNYPHIRKAKYFFDYYAIPSQTKASTPQNMQNANTRQFGAIDQSPFKFDTTSRVSHSIDLTVFLQSFCSQQIQFKGTLDFLIDSQEFINSFRNYLKQQHHIDNPSGKLQIYYWVISYLLQYYQIYVIQIISSNILIS